MSRKACGRELEWPIAMTVILDVVRRFEFYKGRASETGCVSVVRRKEGKITHLLGPL
jgi:hypothetical protein